MKYKPLYQKVQESLLFMATAIECNLRVNVLREVKRIFDMPSKELIEVKCNVCGKLIERTIKLPRNVCFTCKVNRKKLRSKKILKKKPEKKKKVAYQYKDFTKIDHDLKVFYPK